MSSKSTGVGGRARRYAQRKVEVRTEVWWKKLRERDNLEDLGVDWMLILKKDFQARTWNAVGWIHLA